MQTPLFYMSYALRALRRGGQRTLLAIICVAFGVMSLVAMQLLSAVIMDTVLVNPRLQLDGDLNAFRANEFLDDADLAYLEDLVATGQIEAYSLTSSVYWLLLRLPDSGRVAFVTRGLGVDPAAYPLSGEAVLVEPAGATLAQILTGPDTVALTQDVARETGVGVGDVVRVAAELGGIPTSLRVTGIISDLPDREGSKLVYNLDTAQRVIGREQPVNNAALVAAPGVDLAEILQAEGWNVRLPEDVLESTREVRDLFDTMLRGAGMLGLLVGGIGVANTMQVSLARRMTEIAMLKTLGYRQADLGLLFAIEAALLGLIGSLVGVAAALGLSEPLIGAFGRIGSMLLVRRVDPMTLVSGVVAGTLTTVIFALLVVGRSAGVRPAVLLHGRPAHRTWRQHLGGAGLFLLLALPFSLISSLLMGSVIKGVGVVLLALAGFVVLGLLMWAALFVFVRLPAPGSGILQLARNNLKRSQLRAVTALIALFVGVFAIGLALTVIVNGQNQVSVRSLPSEGYNLALVVADEDVAEARAGLEAQGVDQHYTMHRLTLAEASLIGPDGEETALGSTLLDGYDQIAAGNGIALTSGAPFGSNPSGVYLPDFRQSDTLLAAVNGAGPGASVRVTLGTGAEVILPLVGFYSHTGDFTLVDLPRGPVATGELVRSLVGEGDAAISMFAAVPAGRLVEVTEQTGALLPDAMVFNALDLNNLVNQMINNLFIFVVSVAGLAMVAGAVLIANSVGLALVERTREIGVLKAVGFGSGSVLRAILVEQGLLGLLSGVVGIGGVWLGVLVLNLLEPNAELQFYLPPLLGVAAFAILLAAGSAALVAWRPVHVRPLEVLRAE